jgi:hypothetical protein
MALIKSIIFKIAVKQLYAYLLPKVLPIVNHIKEVEQNESHLKKNLKHNKVRMFIKMSPEIMGFIEKYGFKPSEVDVLISLIVLFAKKPPVDKENRDKWKEKDIKIIFDAIGIIVNKWVETGR